jgi:hypothetical protein
MKFKEVTLSVILNAFLGYLWLLFLNHILIVTETLDNVIFRAIVIILGTTLSGEIVGRITPFDKYKLTHPIKLVGFSSCLVMVFVGAFIFNLV